MMTHHYVVSSSLRIKIVNIDKFGDFSCDFDHNSRTDVFRDPFYLRINQCDLRRRAPPVECPLAAQHKQPKRACYIWSYRSNIII